MTPRTVALALALFAPAALADGVEGWGRISLGGGWRWVPNWYFQGRAAEVGRPMEAPSPGGPQGTVSFGFGATAWLEVAVDGIVGYESFTLAPGEVFHAVTYGGLLGGRLVATDVFFPGFMPWVSVQAGVALAMLNSNATTLPERALGGLSVSGGATWKVNERYGVGLEARWLYGRHYVTDIAGINVGGVWFSATFTIFFPPSQRTLVAPGF